MTESERRRRRTRPRRTYERPRVSLLYVLRRTGYKLLEVQVWDVAGTMTFYLLLSLFPGAVAVVSGSIRGETTTMPLHIEILHNEYDEVGAFSVAFLLALLAVVTLVLKVLLERRMERRAGEGG